MSYNDRAWQQAEAPDQPTSADLSDFEWLEEYEADYFAAVSEGAALAAYEREMAYADAGYFAAAEAEQREADDHEAQY